MDPLANREPLPQSASTGQLARSSVPSPILALDPPLIKENFHPDYSKPAISTAGNRKFLSTYFSPNTHY